MAQRLATTGKKPSKVGPTAGGSVYVDPAAMEWQPSQFEGIEIKVLYQDKEAARSGDVLSFNRFQLVSSNIRAALNTAFEVSGNKRAV